MKATRKPIEIEFFPFERKYFDEILKWSTEERPIKISIPRCPEGKSIAQIATLEGTMVANEGEFVIIKGVKGEVYPCQKNIFYEIHDVEQEV